jgi:hypothetical protein
MEDSVVQDCMDNIPFSILLTARTLGLQGGQCAAGLQGQHPL